MELQLGKFPKKLIITNIMISYTHPKLFLLMFLGMKLGEKFIPKWLNIHHKDNVINQIIKENHKGMAQQYNL